MSVNFVEGKPQKYVATISFNLNLENKKSSKVNVGDVILFDGYVATYTSASNITITGETRSLRSAILAGWLVYSKNGKVDPVISPKEVVTTPKKDFDNKRGGNMDTFIEKENNKVSKVIREKDVIVKETKFVSKVISDKVKSDKLEVIDDQVPVKEATLSVTSSTTVPRTKFHSKVVEASDSYGADNTLPLNMKRSSAPSEVRKKKTFLVDATTPSLHEEATLDEVKRAIKSDDIQADNNQEAVVVKKIKTASMEVQEMDGVVLKKRVVPKDMTVTTKSGPIGGGEAAPVDISTSQDTKVVKKAGDYLSMLPADWSAMHWVKKEKWIKVQTNKKLIEYLLKVEKTKAILDACEKRIKELA